MLRVVCTALGVVMFVFTLAGCGGSGDDSGPGQVSTTPGPDTPDDKCNVDMCHVCADNEHCKECMMSLVLSDDQKKCEVGTFTCQSDLVFDDIVGDDKKGLTLDDTTFRYCPDKIPLKWPNTNSEMKSIRLFKAWQKDWDDWEGQKENAWAILAMWVKKNNIQVFMGTQISCNEDEDDADWENTKGLMKMLGPEHIMGLAIGNELELLWQYNTTDVECLKRIWDEKYFFKKFEARVSEFDEIVGGTTKVPVTTVSGLFALEKSGDDHYWVEKSNTKQGEPYALLDTFMKDVKPKYADRFAFTFNIYGYFDTSAGACGRVNSVACIGETDCFFTNVGELIRTKMKDSGFSSSELWIGETGWSYPKADSLAGELGECKAWSTQDTFQSYYEAFLKWDMKFPNVQGPDHVFYFTMRDSSAFGEIEHFGLLYGMEQEAWCETPKCKLQKTGLSSMNSSIV